MNVGCDYRFWVSCSGFREAGLDRLEGAIVALDFTRYSYPSSTLLLFLFWGLISTTEL